MSRLMHISMTAAVLMFCHALADFYIYKVNNYLQPPGGVRLDEFAILDDLPDCDDIRHHYPLIPEKDDVSGDKYGVRCDKCKGTETAGIEVLELNLKTIHFTIYKNRDWKMVDTNDAERGQCHIDISVTYQCILPQSRTDYDGGSLFFCESEYNATSIHP
ncbi:hypothetical protein BJ170DRAFT_688397 [Xylariales sp. AK1849]|nr:hypothetical protein BJ170DRAFT_688397 [Xylariales sp. AK1849]